MSQIYIDTEEVFRSIADDRARLKLVIFLRKIAPGRFLSEMKLDFKAIIT